MKLFATVISVYERRPAFWLTALALFLALTSVRLTFTDGDEGRYTLLGMAVAEGHGRTDIMLPEPQPDILTPPFYPMVVGATMKVVGQNLVPLKASSLLFFTLAVWVLVKLIDRRYALTPLQQAAAIIIGSCNVVVMGMNWMILAEMWFLLTLALAWWLAEDDRSHPLRPVAAGVMAGLSVLIRPSGLALLPAGLLHYFTRKRWRDGGLFLLGGLLVNIPTAWNTWKAVGTPVAYLTHYRPEAGSLDGGQGGSSLLTVIENMVNMSPTYHFHFVPRHLFFRIFDTVPLGNFLAWGVGALVLLGLLIRVKQKRFGIADWFYLGYMALISTYNQPDFAAKGEYFYQDRYLHPLLPLAGIYLVLALIELEKRLPKNLPLLTCGCAAYILLTSSMVSAIRIKNELKFKGLPPEAPERHLSIDLPEHQGYGRYLEAVHWAAEHLEEDAILISRKPRHTYIFSKRRSFRPTELNRNGATTWETWTAFLHERPVYVLQDGYDESTGYGRDGRATIDPILAEHSDRFEMLYATAEPVTRVWRLNPLPAR